MNRSNLKNIASVIVLMTFLISMPAVAATDGQISVKRDLALGVKTGETFTVTLDIDINEDNAPKAYILNEKIPDDFKLIDSDSSTYNQKTGTIKWLAIEGMLGKTIEDTTYTYTLQAPEMPGTYTFSGGIALASEEIIETTGNNALDVAESKNTPTGFASVEYMPVIYYGLGGFAVLIVAGLIYYRYRGARK